jgi:hypothetical protein
MQITTTDDVALNYLNALVYGNSGVGKTTSLRTLPQDRTLLLNTERGTLPLSDKKFPVIHIESWDDFRKVMVAVQEPKGTMFEKLMEGKTVIALDSLSRLAALCQREIVTVDRRALVSSRTHGKKDTPDGIYSEVMTQEDWGLYRVRMLNALQFLTHAPYHFVATCLSDWNKDQQGNEVVRCPNLGGKTSRDCAAFFDLVLHMEADREGKRFWRTQPNNLCIAKDATGKLAQLEETDWMQVFKTALEND